MDPASPVLGMAASGAARSILNPSARVPTARKATNAGLQSAGAILEDAFGDFRISKRRLRQVDNIQLIRHQRDTAQRASDSPRGRLCCVVRPSGVLPVRVWSMKGAMAFSPCRSPVTQISACLLDRTVSYRSSWRPWPCASRARLFGSSRRRRCSIPSAWLRAERNTEDWSLHSNESSARPFSSAPTQPGCGLE